MLRGVSSSVSPVATAACPLLPPASTPAPPAELPAREPRRRRRRGCAVGGPVRGSVGAHRAEAARRDGAVDQPHPSVVVEQPRFQLDRQAGRRLAAYARSRGTARPGRRRPGRGRARPVRAPRGWPAPGPGRHHGRRGAARSSRARCGWRSRRAPAGPRGCGGGSTGRSVRRRRRGGLRWRRRPSPGSRCRPPRAAPRRRAPARPVRPAAIRSPAGRRAGRVRVAVGAWARWHSATAAASAASAGRGRDGSSQDGLHHALHLRLGRGPVADHGVLDLVRRVLHHRHTAVGGLDHGQPRGLANRQGGPRRSPGTAPARRPAHPAPADRTGPPARAGGRPGAPGGAGPWGW